MTERDEASTPTRVGLSEGLGPLPWGDIEAWLEVSDASKIASDIRAYADAEVARAVAAERQRWMDASAAVSAGAEAAGQPGTQTVTQIRLLALGPNVK